MPFYLASIGMESPSTTALCSTTTAMIAPPACLHYVLRHNIYLGYSFNSCLCLGCFLPNRARGLDEHYFVSNKDAVYVVCGRRLVGCSRQPTPSPLWSREFLVARDADSDKINRTGVAGK